MAIGPAPTTAGNVARVSDAGSPPPPPPRPLPPPDLPPPPGAVWYQDRPAHIGRLHRIGGLATALSVLLALIAVAHLASLTVIGGAVDASETYLDPRSGLSDDDYSEELLPMLGLSTLAGLATLATAVITMIWLYRVAANHRALGRRVTFGPGWAIGGWFAPPGLFVIPALMTREHWKAAEPSSPPDTDSWRRSPEPVLVWVWFILFGVAPLVLALTSGLRFGTELGGDVDAAAENLADAGNAMYLSSVVSAAGAIAWLFVVRGLTARHRLLTGEAGG